MDIRRNKIKQNRNKSNLMSLFLLAAFVDLYAHIHTYTNEHKHKDTQTKNIHTQKKS